jgi:L-asparagine transporter-like permease
MREITSVRDVTILIPHFHICIIMYNYLCIMISHFHFKENEKNKKHRHIIMMHKTEYILLALFDEK